MIGLLRGLLVRLRTLLGRGRAERELDEELRYHLDREVALRMARGVSAAEADSAARRDFGNAAALRQEVREGWGWVRLDNLLRDLNYVGRQARRMPVTTTLAVLTFAIGIGAATTVGTLANAALWRPLPFRDPDQLVFIGERSAGSAGTLELISGQAVAEVTQRSIGLARTAAYAPVGTWSLLWQRDGRQVPVAGSFVSPEFFELLGVTAQQGRMFTARDEAPAAVVSEQFWRSQLGGRPDVIGQVLSFPLPFTIVGIAPRGFRLDEDVEVWLPLNAASVAQLGDRPAFRVVGRLQPGAAPELLAPRLSQDRERAFGVSDLRRTLVGDARPEMLLLLAAVIAVVGLGCVNVTTLLLDRSVARAAEVALRTALGASPARIAMQAVTEAVMLALVGGLVGAVVAVLIIRGLPALAPASLPWIREVQVDWAVLLAAGALTLISGLVAGLLPAWRSWQRGRAHASGTQQHTQSRGVWRVRRGLATSQVAFAFALLVVTGLMVRSLLKVLDVDLGFQPRGVLALRMSSDIETAEARAAFYQSLLGRVRALPGVTAAAITTRVPLREGGAARLETREQSGDAAPQIEVRRASRSYFATMGIKVARGREFADGDRLGSPGVAILNETAARLLWPNRDPVGEQIRVRRPRGDAPWLSIVGVVGDVRHFGVESQPSPEVYLPMEQGPPFGSLLVVRAAGDLDLLAQPVRDAVTALDAATTVFDAMQLESLLADAMAARRYTVAILSAFGALALLLAFVGVYATVAHIMRARAPEVAIRMCLGASPGSVLGRALADAVRAAVPGLVLGAAAGLVAARFLRGLLFGIGPVDPLTLGLVGGGVALVVLLAALAPAVRSARLDPATVLKGS